MLQLLTDKPIRLRFGIRLAGEKLNKIQTNFWTESKLNWAFYKCIASVNRFSLENLRFALIKQ